MSAKASGLGVVSSLSPAKMEPAPAKKQRAWPSGLISVRPALRRTVVVGNTMRVTAIIRTISKMSTGV